MKKQSGFTLIELMVVMAIIAILATAGLSAYTGYIKKARDTTRIADIQAINNIVTGMMSSAGVPPSSYVDVQTAIVAANNGIALRDPRTGSANCFEDQTSTTNVKNCDYVYRLCDSSTGFAIGARFESTANQKLYIDDGIGITAGSNANGYQSFYDLGSCKTLDNNTINTAGYGYLN